MGRRLLLLLRFVASATWETVRWHVRGARRSGRCADVESFHDGALGYSSSVAFTAHLPGCEHCRARLTGLMQLDELGRQYVEDKRRAGR